MLQTGIILNQRYEIVRLIAEGGMGAVYEGRDLKFGGSPVAIKRCLLTGEAMQRAFVREAELLANLSHPGVAKVRDLFVEPDGQYLVMEYIPGRDLEEILNDRGAAIPTEEALGWMDQTLDALIYMHSQRPPVIHRDLKPSNIKLTPSGHVMLIDFGLAKGNGTSSLVGYSANYAPLEQLHGGGTDAQSDLYSLGATMYRLLTGQAPESSLSRVKQLAKDQRDPLLRVNAINNQVPAVVAQVIWDAMALEREDRLQSAGEMRRRLREASKSRASNVQQLYTPTEVVQGAENNSSVPKGNTEASSIAQPTVGSPQKSSITNAPVVSLPAGPGAIEACKTGVKNVKVKPVLVFACLVMLLFSTVAGICYKNWQIASSQRLEAERYEKLRRQEDQLKAAERGTAGQGQQAEQWGPADRGAARQGQQAEQRGPADQGAARQKQADDQAAREAERLRQEAAAREAERLRQEDAAREAERQRQEAAAEEAERKRQEAEAGEAEKKRQEEEAGEGEENRK